MDFLNCFINGGKLHLYQTVILEEEERSLSEDAWGSKFC